METNSIFSEKIVRQISQALKQNKSKQQERPSIHFRCPLCGEKEYICNAKHYLKEVNREYLGDTCRITSYNFRVCPACDSSIKKGYIFAILLWVVVGSIFYAIFAYIFFYVDDFLCTKHLFGELSNRSGWDFFWTFVVLTIFVSWLPLLICYGFCTTFLFYKSNWDLGSKLEEALEGNAIAPLEEKDPS